MKSPFSGDTFFAHIMNVLGSVLWTGILWLIASLPVVTIPAASMAAYHTVSRVVRRDRGYVTQTFFAQFVRYLKKWLTVSLLDLGVLVWLLFDIIYLHGYGTEFSVTLSYITYGILAVYLAVNLHLCSFGSRFSGSRWEIFKLAVYATFRHILTTLVLVAVLGAGIYLVYRMPWCILFLPGLLWYLSSLLTEPVLLRYTKGARLPEEESRSDDEDEGEVSEVRRGNLILRKRKKRKAEEDNEEDDDEDDDFTDRVVPKK